ncbi:karyopherin alpha [Loa loa]|uniref:Karyopherin alpha n=1 Tax=Loa loa TaxID=7209 RepID=A0A1S0TKE4_LOALO|nr:karyopherin alpha [Loa loa]EFO15571.2 karyopherin alpha [Loa loa]
MEIKTIDEDDANLYNICDAEIKLYLQLLLPYNSLTAQACAVEYFRRLLIRNHVPPLHIADSLGGLEALVECAALTDGETRDQVFWTLGNIALDCPICHEKVQNSTALPLMIGVLVNPMFICSKWTRNLVWALSQIFRGGIHTLHHMFIQATLTGLRPVLYMDDSKTRVDAVWTIAYIADDNVDGRQIDAVLQTPHLLERLIELLDESDTMRAALRALGNLVAGGDDQTQAVLNAGLLPRMMKLFRFNMPVYQKREIAWILSNIAAGSRRQIDLLFETNNIVETLIDTFYCDDYRIRKEVGWTVTNALTGASISRSRWLCGSNVISLIPQLLHLHTERDLIDRTLYAIELLITKRINFIFVLENYHIFQTIRQIVYNQNNQFDALIKARARRILNKENDYKAHQIPPGTYILVR